jgi:hypothetical protein
VDNVRIPRAGDPFTSKGVEQGPLHVCNSGWVSLEVETEEGETEEVLYLCRRCSEAEEAS